MDYHKTDPEFMERFEQFAFQEVPNEEGQQLDDKTRYTAILASLMGCQGVEEYEIVLAKALDSGLSPIAVKEIVYQAVDYLGIGRVLPFLKVTNQIFEQRNIPLPLEGQSTTTLESRPYQPMAGCKLLWRLLYPYRSGFKAEGNDYVLLFGSSGRV